MEWIRRQHPDDGSTGLLEEFRMPRPSARIDLAVVNGELAGFEIKSDADKLTRLSLQVPAFSRFFDRVSIVTTFKHLDEARRRVPAWWGLIIYRHDGTFNIARKGRRNAHIDVRSLLFALSAAEIAALASLSGMPIKNQKKDEMVDAVATGINHSAICRHARDIIRLRTHSQSHSSPAIVSLA